jgi:acetyl esterase/lipase
MPLGEPVPLAAFEGFARANSLPRAIVILSASVTRSMIRISLLAASLLIGARISQPQTNPSQPILLWPNGAPGALGVSDADKPSLTPFIVAGPQAVPTAIIICPGGSYTELSFEKEGTDAAKWLNQLGISAFVLRYRLGPKYHHPIELGDAQRAIRFVRLHAKEYGFAANRIGIWGFSAGGHLASTAGTHFDAGDPAAADPIERQSSRPDFMILAYPVITLTDPFAHAGSRHNLLGEYPDPTLIKSLSNETQVSKDTPPTFLFHTSADKAVPAENSVLFYLALQKAGVPSEIHIFQSGDHGVGRAQSDPILRVWPSLLAAWLRAQGLR